MKQHITFLHGGGSKDDFDADARLASSLKEHLGASYTIHYPFLPNNGTPDLGRRKQITDEILASQESTIWVAHSLGASMLLATLSEYRTSKSIKGIFLLATPHWQGDEDWVQPFKLRADFASHLDENIPIYFYHCRDDEEVPIAHLSYYRHQLPKAVFCEIQSGGHQFGDDLSMVAEDIRNL